MGGKIVMDNESYCMIEKINKQNVKISASFKLGDTFRTIIALHDIDMTYYRKIEKLENINIYARAEEFYLTALNCIILNVKSISNLSEEMSYCEVILESTDVLHGKSYFYPSHKIQNIIFKVTDGVELIGLAPYKSKNTELFENGNIDIAVSTKSITADLKNEKYIFSVFPEYHNYANRIELTFTHLINYCNDDGINWCEIRNKVEFITSLLELLSGELVTITNVDVLSEGVIFTYWGLCSYPISELSLLKGNGFDATCFLRLSLFKLSDFPNMSNTLTLWSDIYSKIKLSFNAYQTLLLEENVQIITSGKFLTSMQLVEGYMTGLVLEDNVGQDDFNKKKDKLLENYQEGEEKEFLRKNCVYTGQFFLKSLKEFTFQSLGILYKTSKTQFNAQYDSLLKKVKDERDIYTHASNRYEPQIPMVELMRITVCYKYLYRICLIEKCGLDSSKIKNRLINDRTFIAYINSIFKIQMSNDDEILEFDKDMWEFSEIK